MKRTVLTLLFVCFTVALSGQESFPVKYQGSRPTISDFAWSFLSNAIIEDEGMFDESTNAFKQAWIKYRKGLPQDEGDTLIVDQKNGYVVLESRRDENLLRWEMCYWNEANGKYKLIAYNVSCYNNGRYFPGQYDGLIFLRYDNAAKKMEWCENRVPEGIYDIVPSTWFSFDLPRTGKDLVATWWYDDGKTMQKTLKWNGQGFDL